MKGARSDGVRIYLKGQPTEFAGSFDIGVRDKRSQPNSKYLACATGMIKFMICILWKR